MAKQKFGFTLLPDQNFDAEVRRLRTTPERIQKEVRNELITMAENIRNHIITSMKNTPRITRPKKNSKTGAQSGNYNWMVGGKMHIPSSPGYAPASIHGGTGMISRIKKDVRQDGVEVGARKGTDASKYPIYLEKGTKNMDARPWLEPAFIDEKRVFYATIRNNVLNAIRK